MAIKITGPYFSSLVQDESRIECQGHCKMPGMYDKEVGQGLERFV
jgi:hypothetical protein